MVNMIELSKGMKKELAMCPSSVDLHRFGFTTLYSLENLLQLFTVLSICFSPLVSSERGKKKKANKKCL